MATIKTIQGEQGQELKAQEMNFKVIAEHWNEYALEDGTTVRVRTNVIRILWVLDQQGNLARTPEGDPFLVVNHRSDLVASG